MQSREGFEAAYHFSDEARGVLARLRSRFQANADRYPDFEHILIEIPYEEPARRPIGPLPPGTPFCDLLAYDARTIGARIASWALPRDCRPAKEAELDRLGALRGISGSTRQPPSSATRSKPGSRKRKHIPRPHTTRRTTRSVERP